MICKIFCINVKYTMYAEKEMDKIVCICFMSEMLKEKEKL